MKSILILFAAPCLAIKLGDLPRFIPQEQTAYSDEGQPLHGIVGWDDLFMKPTQREENGARSGAAAHDDFLACTFGKYENEHGLLDRPSALGAMQEVVRHTLHLSQGQTNHFLMRRFDAAFDEKDPNKNKMISVDEMYDLVKTVIEG